MANEIPNPEAGENEPLDEELIAYLDGELEEPKTKEVEDRLARDASLRARAEAYKKTYDLLDFLPKPEPSPDFASRTLTRLEPALGAEPVPVSSTGGSNPGPVPGLNTTSGRMTNLPSGSFALPAQSRRGWRLLFGLAAVMAALSGYFGHAALRPFLEPSNPLSLEDIRIIESLPLYLGVDDLAFVKELDRTELFDTDSLPTLPAGFSRAEVSQTARDQLTDLFKAFPPTRQQELRVLHQAISNLSPPERQQTYRILENYAVWLDRLQDSERKEILSAPSSVMRLEVIQQLKERTWRAGLSVRQRERLKGVADDDERQRLITGWKLGERLRREEWKLARQQRETPLGPFEDPANPKTANLAFIRQVEDFLRSTLGVETAMFREAKVEIPTRCRLSREEILDLRQRYDSATREGEWFNFGLMVYRLAERHPYLPETGGQPPVIDSSSAIKVLSGREIKPKTILNNFEKLEKRMNNSRGKWPDYALEIAELFRRNNQSLTLEWLGPCRPGEFNQTVNSFQERVLLPMLSDAELAELKKLEGKWPDYPRMMIQLARKKDESIPGVMLPGKPSVWAKFYTITTAMP